VDKQNRLKASVRRKERESARPREREREREEEENREGNDRRRREAAENKLLADNGSASFDSRGVYYLLQRLHFS